MPELPKIVVQRLQTAAKDQIHPDPDLITAFVENTLPQADRNKVLDHLAHCGDCREVVSFSLPEPAAMPASVRPARSLWLAWPGLRWGALAACVVIVAAAVILRRESGSKPETTEMATVERKTAAPASPEPSHMEAADQLEAPRSARRRDALSAPAPAKKAPVRRTSEDKERSTQVAGELPAPAAQTSTADVSTAAEAAPPPTSSMDELVPGRAKDVPSESRAANLAAGTSARMIAKSKMSAAVSMNKTAYPSTTLVPRWTLTSNGTLQRSLDSGTTWDTIEMPGQSTLRALAANGLDIWVGGSNGALYHSSDAGQHWTQVHPIANGELLSGDIIGVEFTDLQHGTLTTSAKETWITADAGQTWQKKWKLR